jgi:hypothetical protein
MDLNPRQQKLAFAVIVVMLAGLGVYLILPKATGGQHAAASVPSSQPAQTAPASTAPPQSAGGAVTPAPSSSATVNIFQWLPFTQDELVKAASVASQAASYYDTFRYDESAATYGNRMSGLVTGQYLQVLESDYATFGVAKQRAKQKEISSASAVINSLRAFGGSSLTFVVTISQRIQTTSGTTTPSSQFAITVVNTGGTWQVNQIQPATAGNQ